jgi:hypothetical protein
MSDKLYIRFCFCLGLLLCSKSGISQITKDSLFLQHLIGKEQYHDAITFTNQLERKYPISTQAQLQLAYQKDLPSIRSNSSIRQVSTSLKFLQKVLFLKISILGRIIR